MKVVHVQISSLVLLLINLPTASAIGHNGRIDMLHTVSHKEEIDSLLNKRYTGDAAPAKGGQIHHVKEVVNVRNEWKNDVGEKMSRKALLMAAKNGTLPHIFFFK